MAYCVTWLLITLATTHAWNLKTNVDYITPHDTNNVELICTQDKDQTSEKELKTINGIRITKLDPIGTKYTFAEIHVLSRKPWSKDKDANVEGSLNQADGEYLKVTWPVANDDTEGAYGCEVSGYDVLDSHVTIHVRPSVKINRKLLTGNDVINLIRNMMRSHQEKQKELEREILSLRKLLNENRQSTRQHIRTIDDEIKLKLSDLQNTIESTCSNDSSLRDQVSEMKNFTVNRLLAAENHNQKELDKLSSHFQNTSSTFEKQLSEMVQNLSTFKVHLKSSVDSLSDKDRDLSSRLNSTTNSLTKQIHSVDTKYDRISRRMFRDFTGKIAELERKCPCNTTPKPTPKPVIVSDWPGGNYALVRPVTGCANLHALESTGRSLFKTIPYTDTGYANVKSGVNKAKEFKLIVASDSKKSELNYCVKDTSIPSLSSPQWPKGTYCIGHIEGGCPSGFRRGYLNYHFKKDGKVVGYYRIEYCCRADQKASVPIKLPKTLPFYLYRFKGTCQQVEGMTVKSDALEVQAESFNDHPPGDQVDSSESNDTIFMCYYQPTCPGWCSK